LEREKEGRMSEQILRLASAPALGIGLYFATRAAFRALNKALAIKRREDGPHAAL
jgi:hypothetical protein